MNTRSWMLAVLLLPLSLGCSGSKDDDTGAAQGDGGDGSDGSDGADGGAASTVSTFPDGDATWTGTAEVSNVELDVVVNTTHTDGRVTGDVQIDFLGTPLAFTFQGTVDRLHNELALVPLEWVGDDPELGLLGLSATYDPDAGTLIGVLRDPTSWTNNDPDGGPLLLTTTASPSEVDPAELEGGGHFESATPFSGTFQCASATRDLSGTLSRFSDGRLTGSMSFDETDGLSLGTFGLDGVVDASTGHVTLLPLPWTEDGPSDSQYVNFFVDGTVDANGMLGTVYQNIGAVYVDDQFIVAFE